MRKITNLFFAATAFVAFGSSAIAQNSGNPIDFESAAGGNNWAWTIFENGTNAPADLTVVANPGPSALNQSANCVKFIVESASSMPWAGAWSKNIGNFTFSSSNCVVKVLVYKSVISPFLVKFENATNAADNTELKVSNTKINEWEELSFDFTAQIGRTFGNLVIIPDFPATRTTASVDYYDNIRFVSNAPTTLSSSVLESVLSVFPNPASDKVTVVAASEISEIIISNLLGQAVKIVTPNSLEATVALDGIPAGQYIITVKQVDGVVSAQKIVKK